MAFHSSEVPARRLGTSVGINFELLPAGTYCCIQCDFSISSISRKLRERALGNDSTATGSRLSKFQVYHDKKIKIKIIDQDVLRSHIHNGLK